MLIASKCYFCFYTRDIFTVLGRRVKRYQGFSEK